MLLADLLPETRPLIVSPPEMPSFYPAAVEFRPVRYIWQCTTELDARGCPPPKPLDAILAALTTFPGKELFVRTNNRPDELLESLRLRNVIAVTIELADATWRTRILPT